MTRFRRVVHSVASGYVVLLGTALYALGSLSLASHYLSEERFGLWGLLASISSYLSLIDLGMSASAARLLIDHKDQRQTGTYGSLIQTGWLVLTVQGAILFLVGFGLAPALGKALGIEPELEAEFIQLVRLQSAVLGLGFLTRVFSQLLYAHQRMDIINYSQLVALGLGFVLLWWCFGRGQGVFSLIWATLLGSGLAALMSLTACWRLGLFPPAGAWGRPSWRYFRELFDYGKDMFLIAVGTQLIMASQTIIITSRLRLGSAAVWYAGTRAFNLLCQAIWRISDMSAPAFSEMIARSEQSRLRERYQAVLMLTASVSGVAAVAYALCNSLFVTIWCHHKYAWPPLNDMLLGVWTVVLGLLHCHNGFVLLTKQVGFMRYIYFVEGLVFVSVAFLTARWGGFPAVIICSIVCSTFFSGAYGVWRISNYFGLSLREVGLRWLAPLGRVLLLFVPVALLSDWASKGVAQPLPHLVLNLLLSGSVGGYILLRYGLSRALQGELLERSPRPFVPLLKRIFAGRSVSAPSSPHA